MYNQVLTCSLDVDLFSQSVTILASSCLYEVEDDILLKYNLPLTLPIYRYIPQPLNLPGLILLTILLFLQHIRK